jgi:prepilin-type N-terminal cleavage/methylation domain-containing protein/prepilin-type processing-associated H-X9-DG protein
MHTQNTLIHPQAGNRGFTLIELLVVISIIAILSAILFPVFSRARENARRTACLSNMKQLGMAFLQYTQDFDEQLPLNSANTGSVRPCSWDACIAPYAGVKVQGGLSPMIYRCPSDVSSDTRRSYAIPYWGNYAPDNGGTFIFRTVAMPLPGVASANVFIGEKLAVIPEPSRTIMLAERPSSKPGTPSSDDTYVNNAFGSYSQSYVYGPGGAGGDNMQDQAYPGRTAHFDGWNYLFVDGHVKWMKPQQTRLGVTTNLAQRVPGNLWARIKE